MLKATKANRVVRIPENRAKDYVALGYTVTTLDGRPVMKPDSPADKIKALEAAVAERDGKIKALEAENKKLKASLKSAKADGKKTSGGDAAEKGAENGETGENPQSEDK